MQFIGYMRSDSDAAAFGADEVMSTLRHRTTPAEPARRTRFDVSSLDVSKYIRAILPSFSKTKDGLHCHLSTFYGDLASNTYRTTKMSATLTKSTPAPSATKEKASTAIFHRSLSKAYDTANGGSGVYIHHPDGSKTLDGSSGAAVSCLGHGHPAVIQAIVRQAQNLAFAHTSFFTSDPAEELAQVLIDTSNGAFTKVMFLSSGTYGLLCADRRACL